MVDDHGNVESVTTQTFGERGLGRSLASRTSDQPSGKPRRRLTSTCGSATWSGDGIVWLSQQVWYFVAGSTPPDIDVDNTEASLRGAAAQWYDNDNDCGIVDEASVSLGYGGRIASSWGRTVRAHAVSAIWRRSDAV